MFWQLLSIFINVVTPVFILVFIGYVLGPRLNLEARTLSRTAYYTFVPAFVFNAISTAHMEAQLALQMTLYATLIVLTTSLLAFITAKLLRRSSEIIAAYVMIAAFGNVGNFGLSLIEFRLGSAAQLPGTVYFVVISSVAFAICVGAASRVRGSGWQAIGSVFTTPALLAIIPAAFFNFNQIEVPLFIARASSLLGDAMISSMLVALGIQLAEVKTFQITLDTFAASAVRLLGSPLLAAILVIPFGLSGLERSAGIIQAAMPAAVLTSIIALEHNIAPDFVTTTVLISTLISLFTLTLVLTFV